MRQVQERGSAIIFACFDCVDASHPSQCRAEKICVSTSSFRKALTCQHSTVPMSYTCTHYESSQLLQYILPISHPNFSNTYKVNFPCSSTQRAELHNTLHWRHCVVSNIDICTALVCPLLKCVQSNWNFNNGLNLWLITNSIIRLGGKKSEPWYKHHLANGYINNCAACLPCAR